MKITIANKKTNNIFLARDDETLLSALRSNGLTELESPCGGAGLCGKCKAKVIKGQTEGCKKDADGYILLCKARAKTDVELFLPAIESTFIFGEVEKTTRTAEIKRAGVALDIGTTTVSAVLTDLVSHDEIASVSALNPQRAFGADVVSRICAAQRGDTIKMQKQILELTGDILNGFIAEYKLCGIEKLVVVANTTMLHLFLGVDPSPMGVAPFTPEFVEKREICGKELGLPVDLVVLLPSISAYVGADIVSGIAVTQMQSDKEPSLLIDMGTNGELALFSEGKLYCCSTAAGPALEGAEISCGMGGVKGAINRVELKGGKIEYTVIGGGEAEGICGCGLIDAIAVMLKSGVIDETGAFSQGALSEINDGERLKISERVYITAKDVRQYQLAKSAIYTGIDVLIGKAGLKKSDLGRVYVAGGLGFFINQASAFASSLLPKEFDGKLSVCGNLALKGALRVLKEPDFMASAESVAQNAIAVELASEGGFMEGFMSNILFADAYGA